MQPRWYLVHIHLEDTDESNPDDFFVDFFCKHLSDEKKKDDVTRYWPDWFKIVWFDKEKSCFGYGRPVLTRPNKTHCRFSKLLVGPFECAPKYPGVAACQFVEDIYLKRVNHVRTI